jgi:tetratricopeptide (TPR) repeat protein
LGSIYFEKGQWAAAQDLLETATQLDKERQVWPDQVKSALLLSDVCEAQGNMMPAYAAAQDAYQASLYAQDVLLAISAGIRMGDLCVATGDQNKAAQYYQQVLGIAGSHLSETSRRKLEEKLKIILGPD